MNRETLVPLEVSRLRERQRKLKQRQQREMESRHLNRDTETFRQSVNATNDTYMVDALTDPRLNFPSDSVSPSDG